MKRILLSWLAVLGPSLALCLAVGGCGKIGDPSPPGPPDQIIYPKLYPTK